MNGKSILTGDEYLEQWLSSHGDIRNKFLFTKRRCHTLSRPVEDEEKLRQNHAMNNYEEYTPQ